MHSPDKIIFQYHRHCSPLLPIFVFCVWYLHSHSTSKSQLISFSFDAVDNTMHLLFLQSTKRQYIVRLDVHWSLVVVHPYWYGWALQQRNPLLHGLHPSTSTMTNSSAFHGISSHILDTALDLGRNGGLSMSQFPLNYQCSVCHFEFTTSVFSL